MKHRPVPVGAVWACWLVAWVLGGTAAAQDFSPDMLKHPWARFGVGSWKQVRVHNESLNEAGQVESTSITDTKTTLVDVSSVDYTIKIEVEVEVVGKRFVAEPKILRQGFHGESKSNGQTAELESLGPGEILIDGRKYPVEMRKVIINGDELRRTSVVHYSDDIVPHVLKRETKAIDVETGKPKYESSVDVTAVEMPFRVLSETKLASHMKTVQRKADGSLTVTLEVYCQDVPGGLVASSSKETNASGRVTTQSTLELREYQVVPLVADTVSTQPGRRRIFHRSRLRGDLNRSANR